MRVFPCTLFSDISAHILGQRTNRWLKYFSLYVAVTAKGVLLAPVSPMPFANKLKEIYAKRYYLSTLFKRYNSTENSRSILRAPTKRQVASCSPCWHYTTQKNIRVSNDYGSVLLKHSYFKSFHYFYIIFFINLEKNIYLH